MRSSLPESEGEETPGRPLLNPSGEATGHQPELSSGASKGLEPGIRGHQSGDRATAPAWLAAYDYDLPDDAIARRPAEPRDSSRLLVLDRASGTRTLAGFRSLPSFLRTGDLLVLNETRVLRARLRTRLARTGRAIEVLLSHSDGESWIALLGPGRRLRPGDRLIAEDAAWARSDLDVPRSEPAGAGPRVAWADQPAGDDVSDLSPDRTQSGNALQDAALILEAPVGSGLWRLRAEGAPVETWIDLVGHVPLPPYLSRDDMPLDLEWYQTTYARRDGAVAAPTAGLHFTPELLARCEAAGIEIARVVLHVGPGTFLPVRALRPEEHRVLPERYEVSPQAAEAFARARARGGRVIAVGTTTVRVLETAAREVSASSGSAQDAPVPDPSGAEADFDRENRTGAGDAAHRPAGGAGVEAPLIAPGSGWTDLTILPGFRFRMVDALITNFHLPRSSLLLLVSAFAGRERILAAYTEARDAGFRFYSYGDAMFIV